MMWNGGHGMIFEKLINQSIDVENIKPTLVVAHRELQTDILCRIKYQYPFLSFLALFDGNASRLDSVEQKVCCFRFSVDAVFVVYCLESTSHFSVCDALPVGKRLLNVCLYHVTL